MHGNIYKELFELVRNEGERLVVVDPSTDDGLVVLRLSEYKRLRGADSEIQTHLANQDKAPILAEKDDKNLSFWDDTTRVKEDSATTLDRTSDSGRIHPRKDAQVSEKSTSSVNRNDDFVLVPEKDVETNEEPAGEEYYFEPAEEIGL